MRWRRKRRRNGIYCTISLCIHIHLYTQISMYIYIYHINIEYTQEVQVNQTLPVRIRNPRDPWIIQSCDQPRIVWSNWTSRVLRRFFWPRLSSGFWKKHPARVLTSKKVPGFCGVFWWVFGKAVAETFFWMDQITMIIIKQLDQDEHFQLQRIFLQQWFFCSKLKNSLFCLSGPPEFFILQNSLATNGFNGSLWDTVPTDWELKKSKLRKNRCFFTWWGLVFCS